jgi:hydroxymethylbilane synthase
MSAALRLGTRGSQLALYQARTVAALITQTGGPACDIVIIKTSGDRLQDAPLSEIGGKRLFVKEIEDALLNGEIDLAVHSSKDMPALLPEGLTIAGVLPREDPRDAVVLPLAAGAPHNTPELASLDTFLSALGPAPSIGTSSVRRIAQLAHVVKGATFAPIRGNLDTRLRKLDTGDYDALVLAAAGLKRLGFDARISFRLPTSICVPAPGQGIIAIEIRAGDTRVHAAVSPITDRDAETALVAERAVIEALGGGCQTPIGALASSIGADEIELMASVVALDGSRSVQVTDRGLRTRAADLGARVADRLVAQGANEILAEAQQAQTAASTAGNRTD